MTHAPLSISVPHDSGNIEVLDSSDPRSIRLNIRKDGAADYYQWFYFRLVGAEGEDCHLKIENAGGSSYVDGWKNYWAVASYDLEHWFRVDTSYAEGTLSIRHTPAQQSVYYAYFAPYPIERYRMFVADVAQSPLVTQIPLGQTLDGEPLDLFQVGSHAAGKPVVWVIARQHPGESMGSWWMEGFLPRLLDEDDAVAKAVRDEAVFYVVPLVNIDGSRRGHLRTNAAGTDLNRAWAEPSLETSPEVFHIRNKMDETGCNLFLDVHGDEVIANNFIAGAEGIPSWNEEQQARLDHFMATLEAISPAFQRKEGYPLSAPGQGNLKIATDQIAERFGCLAMTLEMPFKDAAILPDENVGWSPERCADLGRSCLDAIRAAIKRGL
ncbi:M14-type cytosolic carboxypeptidase [Parvularcula sp. LCG005]|uniref:M14 family metallopeptidase n=1 Tax=Parvularcula sp. LCG005 TaxID=3078805 RepID=UPI002942B124|nr:M14-type cytosolic carboxypeptidase [Parvularcula sp. LCG005]WOI53945.1 M14-type cytosolic carboxypeptidase [Parvularcula sp. LCG005]